MFQSRTGWAAVLVGIVGGLTAVDVMPLLSEFLTATVGAKIAHLIGLGLSLVATVVAKLSAPKPEPPAT